MPSKIRVLDDLTINKIAAGEVIENPSSVVKELIENAIDAQSDSLHIEIMGGGRHLIRVSDNGTGMCKDDALLMLERHATSKLSKIDDLFSMKTMGFRGEAIPSIASISRFSCITSDGNESTFVKVEGGKLLACDPAQRTQGTTLEIKDLFFNVPVRKRFQRSPAYDEHEILKSVTLMALALPNLKIQLIVNQKPELSLFPAPFHQRVQDCLGNDFYKELIPIQRAENDFQLTGFISKPFFSRPNKQGQYLLINGRAVHSPFISFHVKEAFSTTLPHNRHPSFVLHLNLPPQDIDVNVHPQKREVRLRREEELKRFIYLAVQESLAKERTPPTLKQSLEPIAYVPWEFFAAPPQPIPKPVEMSLPFEEAKKPWQVLTTMKGYIVVEGIEQEGISLVDQERAHSRVLFERLEKKEDKFEKEQLLIPLLIEFNELDYQHIKEHLEEIKALGIELREFAPRTLACDAFEICYREEKIKDLIAIYLEEIKLSQSSSLKENNLKKKLAEKASRHSLSQDKILSFEEGKKLINDLLKCQKPFESPFGKPTLIHLNKELIAKQLL